MQTSPFPRLPLLIPGRFSLGCNYWASHAGTAMWRDWQPEVVEADFARLAAGGIQLLRVFPLWPDFQPIVQLRGQGGARVEIRLGQDEAPLPSDIIGQAGVSKVMLERFSSLCEIAARHQIGLIVGLVTGWMSGRLYVPPALEGLDPITDATSLAWQTRLVRAIVTHARHQSAVVAWDLGNECNCMGANTSRDAAYLWTAAIANTIRAADASRPVVSGMHSLAPRTCAVPNAWTIDDQADLTDLLTTHPYPYWVRHTRNDAVNTLRTTLHATAETRLYADIGRKPCFAEEIGTMGPLVAGDEVSADFARVNLFSLWANDCRGFLWWCNQDQTALSHAPYDWNGVELELGLLRADASPKPVFRELGAFRRFLDSLPCAALPPRRTEAICLLTHNQDAWATAFGAYVLAKQAKLEIEFRHIQQEIPDSTIYLLPSLEGPAAIPRRQWLELLRRVRAGATLYLSLGDGIVPHFNEVAGVELLTRAKPAQPLHCAFTSAPEITFPLPGGDDLRFVARGAEVLASRTDDQSPVFWRHPLGAGQVFVLAAPIESALTQQSGAFDPGAPAYWKFYHAFASAMRPARWLAINEPALAVTEHPLSETSVIVVVINHGAAPTRATAHLANGIRLGRVWHGSASVIVDDTLSLSASAHDACVFELLG